jgi:hypothetical protein
MGMIIIENPDTGERQCVGSFNGYEAPWAQIGPELPAGASPDDLVIADGEWVRSPLVARNARWEAAKAYRALRQSEPLPIPGVVADETIIAQRDTEGQAWIDRFVPIATAALLVGQPFSLTFGDLTNRPFTVDEMQILAIGQASLTQQALCKNASEAVRIALDAALAAGATAEEIEAIDITAGYPAPGAPA